MSTGSLNGGSIRILWDASTSATVTITGPTSVNFTVGGAGVTFPYTLAASTTFDTDINGEYTVSVLHQGFEVANTPDGTKTVRLSGGGQMVFAPTPDSQPDNKFLTSLSANYAAVAPAPSGGSDTAALQALVDALSTAGGIIRLRAGTYRCNLTVGDNVTLVGEGIEATVLKSVAGANTDVIKGANFATLTGTSPATPETAGDNRLTLRDLTIDGDKANNTSGYGIRIWGLGHRWSNVLVRNCKSGGIWTEFAFDVSTFTGDNSHLEAHWDHISTIHNDGNGWTHKGPHDSWLTEFVTYGNTGWGFESSTGANNDGGIHGDAWNSYLNTLGSYKLGAAFNLGFAIASGASGVGTGVEILAASGGGNRIGHLLAGGHATGMILRGSNNSIGAAFVGHTVEAVQITSADSNHLTFTAVDCANAVTITADGGAHRIRGIVSGAGTVKTGTFSGTSTVDIHHATSPIFQLPSRIVTAGGWSPVLPQSNGQLLPWDSTATTVGAAGAGAALPATPVGYIVTKDAAGTTFKIPYYNV